MVCVKVIHNNEAGRTLTVPLESTVAELKKTISESYNAYKEWDIFCLGKRMSHDNAKLSDYHSVNEKSVLFAFAKPKLNSATSAVPSTSEIDSLLGSLQATFSDHGHRAMLIRTANNPETLRNMMDCVAGLRDDFVAQSILKDPCLLIHWAKSENVAKNFTEHPSLFAACQQLIEHMHAEILRHNGALPASYEPLFEGFGEPYSSDEGETEEDNRRLATPAATDRQNVRQPITQQYLAAAIAAAAAATAPPSAPGGAGSTAGRASNFGTTTGPSNPPTGSSDSLSTSSPQLITAEMFRQAVQQALGSNAAQAESSSLPLSYDEQVKELAAMGFVDREENLRALRYSHGDVQGALEHIINEREALENANMGLD